MLMVFACFTVLAIVTQTSDPCGYFFVVCRYGSGITESPENLEGIKAETPS